MGMSIAHGVAAGMGGIRAAGDLVARMQMARKMRIHEAKAYVAEKLKISPFDLSDVHVMREVREELDIGIITSVPGCAKGIEAKARIAQLLDIDIASVNRLKEKMKF
jgi:dimethylamine---corrinoid protein Co-methyltransferase